MASEKQIEANQKNAKLSTGPKTQDGKARSRFNAVTHGLTGTVLDVLPHEDSDEFTRRLNAWFDDYLPTTEAQALLARQAAILSWKIDRADRYENRLLSERVKNAVKPCFDEPLPDPNVLNVLFLKEAELASFDPSNEAERLRRYQFSLHRALLRVLDALEKLKKAEEKRSSTTIGANEAKSVSVAAVETVQQAEAPRSSDRPSQNEAKSAGISAPNKAKSTSQTDWTLDEILSETPPRTNRNNPWLEVSVYPG